MERYDYQKYIRSDRWKRKREAVLIRANYTCEHCFSTSVPLQVHHLTYQHLGDESIYELIALCDSCHKKEHSPIRCWSENWAGRGLEVGSKVFIWSGDSYYQAYDENISLDSITFDVQDFFLVRHETDYEYQTIYIEADVTSNCFWNINGDMIKTKNLGNYLSEKMGEALIFSVALEQYRDIFNILKAKHKVNPYKNEDYYLDGRIVID